MANKAEFDPTTPQFKRRVMAEQCVAQGMEVKAAISLVSEQSGCSERLAKEAVVRAFQEFTVVSEIMHSTTENRAKFLVKRLEDLRERAIDAGELKLELDIVRQMSAVLGMGSVPKSRQKKETPEITIHDDVVEAQMESPDDLADMTDAEIRQALRKVGAPMPRRKKQMVEVEYQDDDSRDIGTDEAGDDPPDDGG